MAMRCSTALVEPPRIMVRTCRARQKKVDTLGMLHTIAFSKAARVIMSRGSMFFEIRLYITGPTEAHSSSFSCDWAGNEDEPGSDMPIASAALAMVLAVYI